MSSPVDTVRSALQHALAALRRAKPDLGPSDMAALYEEAEPILLEFRPGLAPARRPTRKPEAKPEGDK